MIVRLWTTNVRDGREGDYLDFAHTRSRPMFAAAPGCFGVLFLDLGEHRHAACSFWSDAASIESFTSSAVYKQTVRDLIATGALGGEQSTVVYTVEGGFLDRERIAGALP